jgi:hypothetical protein|tara:strand:+ start:1036 stop:1212 length:177 start_codon:yes stop_codon:yes gene_type:complete
MNIKNVKKKNDFMTGELCSYKVTQLDDNVIYVPTDPKNRHYEEIQEWVAAGNTIEEAD